MTTTPSPITSGEALKNEVTITVSGPVGSGKSALLGEIEIMCKALGVPVRYADEAAAQAEKNMTHAEWTAELEMYQPSVVLVEGMPWLATASTSPAPVAQSERDAWISVDEGLPEPGARVLVTRFAGQVNNPCHPGYPGVPWLEATRLMPTGLMFECDIVSTGNVTHWKPAIAAQQPAEGGE